MADTKKILGGLGKVGKRLFAERPDEGALSAIRSAGRATHEQEAAIRAARNAQAAEQMAKLPPRSKKANEAAGLYHPVGGGIKLSRPTSGMNATTVADPKFNPPDIGIITPEQLVKEQAALFPLVGDRAAAGRYLTHVGENELEVPVRLTGGPRYMDANYNPITPEESAAWESGLGRVTALGRQAERAGEGGRPVYGIYTAGSGTNTDFNIMGANALIQQIPFGKITKKAEKEFDRAMREGTKEFPPIPNWPGIRSPEAQTMLLDKSNGIVRTKLFGTMGKENFQSMGFPDVPATRKAIIEPELLDVPTNQAGFRLARMDTTGRIIENPAIPSDYPTAMAGQVAGKLDVPADYKDIFQSHFDARRLLSQPESGDYYSFSRAHPIQYADDAWLNRLMEQRFATERKIKEGEYKEGGEVDIDAADARLEAALGNRMAKGGEVDLEAADARLTDAINARMGMADGGVPMQSGGRAGAAKGVAKGFKRLFADREVLPAAERDANLAKFLEGSKAPPAVYHSTSKDFNQFSAKKLGQNTKHPTTKLGFFTAADPASTEDFITSTSGISKGLYEPGANVMPLHLSIKNPYEIPSTQYLLQSMALQNMKKKDADKFVQEFIDSVKAEGHDGLLIKANPRGLAKGNEFTSDNWVAFEPTQIKSSIGNRGTYDIEDADITKAQGGLAMQSGGRAGVVKGLGQIGKRLLSERTPLPAAERDANLAKFLEPSKTPMRLYHATTATEGGKGEEAIRRLKPSKEGSLGSGAYLTPKTNFANQYAEGAGGNVLPVYAQLKNPLVIEGTGDPMIEALTKLGVDEERAIRMVERAYDQKGYIGKEVETRARAAGYDGLMQYRDGELGEVVSYNPNAVKSAIGNEGTYDTSVPDLSKAEGGAAFKKLQFMAGGGITTSGGTFTAEDLGITPEQLNAPVISAQRMRDIRANAADIATEGKEQLEKEYRQLGRKGGKKDFAIRVGSQILGGVPDLINLGLEGVDLIQGAIPGLSRPESVLDTAGTGDRIPKFRLASDEPWLGSKLFMRKFKEAKLLGENEFPLTEIAAGFASPAIAAGAIKGGKKAVKAVADTQKKRRGGLTAMTR